MATAPKKATPQKASKPGAETYEKPVTFAGTFEDMIAISATGAYRSEEKIN